MGFFGDPQSPIPIPGIGEGDYYNPGIGDFLYPEFLGDGNFLGMGYLTKKQPLV